MAEQTQSFDKHAKFVPLYHQFLLPLLLLTFIGSLVNLAHSFGDHERIYNASLIAVISFSMAFLAFFARIFPLQAQDRAIRAEENLRHYVLTGRLLDKRLTQKQIVGLRFASAEEFPMLAKKAAETSMSQKDIKRAVMHWRADYERL